MEKTLERNSVWLGKDGQKRLVKRVAGFTVLYDVWSILSGAYDNQLLIEKNVTIDYDYFISNCCEQELSETELNNFYKED